MKLKGKYVATIPAGGNSVDVPLGDLSYLPQLTDIEPTQINGKTTNATGLIRIVSTTAVNGSTPQKCTLGVDNAPGSAMSIAVVVDMTR